MTLLGSLQGHGLNEILDFMSSFSYKRNQNCLAVPLQDEASALVSPAPLWLH